MPYPKRQAEPTIEEAKENCPFSNSPVEDEATCAFSWDAPAEDVVIITDGLDSVSAAAEDVVAEEEEASAPAEEEQEAAAAEEEAEAEEEEGCD